MKLLSTQQVDANLIEEVKALEANLIEQVKALEALTLVSSILLTVILLFPTLYIAILKLFIKDHKIWYDSARYIQKYLLKYYLLTLFLFYIIHFT